MVTLLYLHLYVHAGTVRCNDMLPQHAHAVFPVVTSADCGQTLVTKSKKTMLYISATMDRLRCPRCVTVDNSTRQPPPN